ncbi:MAG: lamin tail domain-containing protein [Chloroflexi bacterium]|nr:lamin tail domain-containing protein [Chloroflexota bacterium]
MPPATPTSSPILTPTPEPTVTATPTPSPTQTPTPTPPDVQIACVFFDGVVERVESDEYVEIVNLGGTAQDLLGWRLADIADGSPEFEFPSWMLEPGEAIRVYTNEAHPEWGGFSFGRGKAIWSNDDPDEAGLFNQTGELVSRKSYPPGC